MKDLILRAEQVSEIVKLNQHGTIGDLKYLFYPSFVDCGMTHPDIPFTQWNSFQVHYLINWNVLFPEINAWDFVTESTLKNCNLTVDRLHDIAVSNLKREQFILKDLHNGVFLLKLDNPLIPSITCSILLIDEIWDILHDIVGQDYYIVPLYRDYLFLVTEDAVRDWDYTPNEFLITYLKLLKLEFPYAIPFSDQCFFYNNEELVRTE